MARPVAALLAFVLLGSSVWADVIPTRYADADASRARAAVASRLQDLGVEGIQATVQARTLSEEDARFFGADPNRIQVAGHDDEDDGVGRGEKYFWGGTFLAAAIGVAIGALAHARND